MTYLYSNMTQTLSSAADYFPPIIYSIGSKHLMPVEILELSLFKTLDYPRECQAPFSVVIVPQRKPFSRGIFPLQGILVCDFSF